MSSIQCEQRGCVRSLGHSGIHTDIFGGSMPVEALHYDVDRTTNWNPKKIIEVLSEQSTHAPDFYTRTKIDDLINLMFIHRPIGSNGKHGDGHTPTCGCER